MKVNWLVMRRSFDQWLRLNGVDPKERQGLMRHASFSTTGNKYDQHIESLQRRALDRLIGVQVVN